MNNKMKISAAACMLLALVLLLYGTALAATYQLSGRVTDQSGSPLEGAVVEVLDQSTGSVLTSATTDASGNYALTIEEGTYDVRVIPSIGSGFDELILTNQTIDSETNIDIVLVPAGFATVTGRIIDNSGNPVANKAYVEMTGVGGDDAYTDENGQFSIEVAPGYRRLRIYDYGYDPTLNVPRDYYISSDTSIWIEDNTDLGDIVVPGNLVNIHVQDPAGNPVSNVRIVSNRPTDQNILMGDIPAYGESTLTGNTDANGNLEGWLFSSSSYYFNAYPPEGSSLQDTRLTNVSITENTNVTITLPSPVAVTGRIIDNSGNPVANKAYVEMTGVGGDDAYTDENGQFSIEVAPGYRRLRIYDYGYDPTLNVPRDYYISSDTSIWIEDNTDLGDIVVPGNLVNIHVQDPAGNPVSNVRIVSNRPTDQNILMGDIPAYGESTLTGNTDANGNLEGWLFSSSSYYFNAYPPEGSSLQDTRLTNVSITENTNVTITLPSPVAVTGRIIDNSGNPVANKAYVEMTGVGGDDAYTDENGQFSIEVAPGYRRLRIYDYGYDPTLNVPRDYYISSDTSIWIEDNTDLGDIVVPGNLVNIHVQDPAGNPVSNVRIVSNRPTDQNILMGDIPAYGESTLTGNTDANGNLEGWLFSSSSYYFNAYPPEGLPFSNFRLNNVSVDSEKSLAIVLQFVHAPPATTAVFSPTPTISGTYPVSVTATLSATATDGYVVDATYYSIDNGPDQLYTGPFVIEGEGQHTVRYWSIDDFGVYETPKTQVIEIAALRLVTDGLLPDGLLNDAYSVGLEAAGGRPPYAWVVTEGVLPQGVTLDPATGVIAGTPTEIGAFDFTVAVTDDDLTTVATEFELNVPSSTNIFNGNFETGDLTGWTLDGLNGGVGRISEEGDCFSANNTQGITLNGSFAGRIRSGGASSTDSVGVLTSAPFVAGSNVSFVALSENDDEFPEPDPVSFEVRILGSFGNVLSAEAVDENVVTLAHFCESGEARDGQFSTHFVDTSAFTGQTVRIQFRQHTNIAGKGFFTLIDDVEIVEQTLPAEPDLSVVSAGISFSPATPAISETVTLQANVTNLGQTDETNVVVNFYDFDTLIGQETIAALAPGSSAPVSITTNYPEASFRLITVKVDPDNQIAETNENNNEASQVLQVGTPDLSTAVMVVDASAANTCREDLIRIQGRADYDFDTVPGTQDHPVQGGNVTISILDPVTSDVLGTFTGAKTQVSGDFSQSVLAPSDDGVYPVVVKVTDGTVSADKETTLTVSGECQDPQPGSGGSGGSGGNPSNGDIDSDLGTTADAFLYAEDLNILSLNPDLGEQVDTLIYIHYVGTDPVVDMPVALNDIFPVAGVLQSFAVDTTLVSFPDGQNSSPVAISIPWTNTAAGAHIIQAALEPPFTQFTGNDKATRLVFVGDPPALQIEKQAFLAVDADSDGAISPGDTVSYTITFENQANSDVTGVIITDDYDETLLQEPVNVSDGGVVANGGITWNVGVLAGGATGVVTYEVTLIADEEFPTGSTPFVNFALMSTDQTPTVGTSHEIEVLNVPPPEVTAGGPFEVNEGESVLLTATGTASNGDPVTYAWDLDGDGIFETSGQEVSVSFDDGPALHDFPVQVTRPGGLTAVDTAQVIVVNVDPIVDAGLDQEVVENELVSFNGNFADPGLADTHFVEWDFGDGNGVTNHLTPTHTYAAAGTYTATLTVTDDDAGVGSDEVIIVVNAAGIVMPPEKAYWLFDEGSGVTTADLSGNGYDGTLVNDPVWSANGRYDSALDFDGNDDHVDVGSFDLTGDQLTIAAWINADTFNHLPYKDARIISKANGEDEQDHLWMLSTMKNGNRASLRFRLQTDGWTTTLAGTGTVLPTGSWVHVAAVYDGAVMRLYQNGVEIASVEKTGLIDQDPMMNIWIGDNPSGEGSRPFDGRIDDVRIYEEALSVEQIQHLAIALDEERLGYWTFDEGAGDVAFDSSDNGHDGTLVNEPAWTENGRFAGALDFDGLDDRVEVGTFDASGNEMSIAAWINADSFAHLAYKDTRIVSKADGTDEQDHLWMLSTIKNKNQVSLRFRLSTDGRTETLVGSSTYLPENTWIHVVAVYDGSRMRLYQDGVEIGSKDKTGNIDQDEFMSVWIGDNPPDDGSRPFDGLIDDVVIYDRALTAEEVSALANQ